MGGPTGGGLSVSPERPEGLSLARFMLSPQPEWPPPPSPSDTHTSRAPWILPPHVLAFTVTLVILSPLAWTSVLPPSPRTKSGAYWLRAQHFPWVTTQPGSSLGVQKQPFCAQGPHPQRPPLLVQGPAHSWFALLL